MRLLSLIIVGILFSSMSYADDQFYCPLNSAYIKLGMTNADVVAACGKPLSQQDSNQPVVQKVPVMQLIYNNKGTPTVFYGVYNVPIGNGGAQLQIDVIDKKVSSIKLDSSDSNSVSICGRGNIQVGDPLAKVYSSCGNPSITNNTYINQVIPEAQKPQVWIYKAGAYQPSTSLTFVNGRLQSIN